MRPYDHRLWLTRPQPKGGFGQIPPDFNMKAVMAWAEQPAVKEMCAMEVGVALSIAKVIQHTRTVDTAFYTYIAQVLWARTPQAKERYPMTCSRRDFFTTILIPAEKHLWKAMQADAWLKDTPRNRRPALFWEGFFRATRYLAVGTVYYAFELHMRGEEVIVL